MQKKNVSVYGQSFSEKKKHITHGSLLFDHCGVLNYSLL